MKVKSQSEVAQSCPTLSDPWDCSLPGSSIHGIFQSGVLEGGAIAFSGEEFNLRQNRALFVWMELKLPVKGLWVEKEEGSDKGSQNSFMIIKFLRIANY